MTAPNIDVKSHLMKARLTLVGLREASAIHAAIGQAIEHLIDAIEGLDERTLNGQY